MAKNKSIGGPGRSPNKNLGDSDSKKNVKISLQRDATAKKGHHSQTASPRTHQPKLKKTGNRQGLRHKPRLLHHRGGHQEAKEQLQGHDGWNQEDQRVWNDPHQEPCLLQHRKERRDRPTKGRHSQGGVTKAKQPSQGHTNWTQTIRETGRVFITNLDYSTTEEDIKTLFGKFRPVTNITIPTRSTGKRREFAYATLTTVKRAVATISALHGE